MTDSKFPNTLWHTAIAVSPRASEPGTYDVNITKDWSIANVPLGGYLNSLLTNAVKTHFELHHPTLSQPDPILNHCTFVSRASFDPAYIRVTVSKPGRQFSNVHARLFQIPSTPPSSGILVAEALITQGNLATERASTNTSLPTLNPIPLSDIFAIKSGTELIEPSPPPPFISAATKIRRIFPLGTNVQDPEASWAHPVYGPSVRDEWISWQPWAVAAATDVADISSGNKSPVFTIQSLPTLIDNLKPPAYNFPHVAMTTHWMATLSLTLDICKGPPEGTEGWEKLFLRAVVGRCYGGRYSMDVTLVEEGGDVVAVGRRAEVVLGGERRGRSRKDARL